MASTVGVAGASSTNSAKRASRRGSSKGKIQAAPYGTLSAVIEEATKRASSVPADTGASEREETGKEKDPFADENEILR